MKTSGVRRMSCGNQEKIKGLDLIGPSSELCIYLQGEYPGPKNPWNRSILWGIWGFMPWVKHMKNGTLRKSLDKKHEGR